MKRRVVRRNPAADTWPGGAGRGVFWTISCWLVVALLRGQEPEGPEAPTVESIETKILQTESSQDLEEGLKKKVLDNYRAALTHIKSYRSDLRTLADYGTLVQSGPDRVQRIRDELQKPAADPAELLSGFSSKSISDLEAALIKTQTELASAKGRLSAGLQSISEQQDRPQKIREELSQARDKLVEIEAELKAAPDPQEHPQLQQARSELLHARKLARTTEIKKLEQELVVYDVRLNLLKAERDRDERSGNDLQRYITTLQEAINSKRRAEAEQVQAEAEQAREAAAGKHPILVSLANENERLSNDLKRLTDETAETNQALQRVVEELRRIDEEHESARKKLTRVGLTGIFGEILVEQRRKLPDLNQFRRTSAQRRAEIARLRVEEIKVEERKQRLGDIDKALGETIEGARTQLSPTAIASLEADARVLLRDQANLLEKLELEYGRYLKALGDLDYQQRELTARYREYALFIDEHLLWTPSAAALGPSVVAQLPTALAWFLSADNWRSAVEAEVAGLSRHAGSSLVVSLFVLSLLLARKSLVRRLDALAVPVGKKYADSFLVTAGALLVTIAIAAPIPIAVAFSGWLLVGTFSSPPFASAVGEALVSLGGMLFIFQGYLVFCQENGVAAAHFNWGDRSLAVFRRNVRWLMLLGLPVLFVVTVTEAQPEEPYRNALGRICFLGGMVLVAIFAARVLAPGRGALRDVLAAAPDGWLFRFRYVWFFGAVAVPLAIAAIAAAGYYYTALQLDHRVLYTVLTILAGVIVYHLLVRWLLIARRRLAVARAKAKRAAQLAAQGEEQKDESTLELEVPEIDLATIKEQTHGAFRTAIVLGVVISLTAVWADVLPALGVLDQELWKVTVDGQEAPRTITIASVFLCAIIVVFTFVSARNLPGLLEVSVIRKLPFDPGSRYAISTIGQYLVVAVGLVLAAYTMGVGWSHVQWLVAALSVGLGFGLQEIFANFVSGLIILLERPIRVGDTVTIGEISGTVTRIRIRATTITDWDQKELVVPNKSFITGQLVNWSLSNPVTRLIVNVGLAYGSDTELALKLMLRAAKENSKVLAEPEPCVFFVGFGDSTLNFEVRVFVKELSNRARTTIVHELHMAIDKTFRENDVVIAFPQRDIHIKSDQRFKEGSSPFADKYGTDLS